MEQISTYVVPTWSDTFWAVPFQALALQVAFPQPLLIMLQTSSGTLLMRSAGRPTRRSIFSAQEMAKRA